MADVASAGFLSPSLASGFASGRRGGGGDSLDVSVPTLGVSAPISLPLHVEVVSLE